MDRTIKKIYVFLVALFLVVLIAGNVFAASLYTIDPGHSTVGFAVRHLVVSVTRGEFTDFSGEIEFDPENFDTFRADLVIQAKSIDTHLEARDKHLRNADFFDVDVYPTITFTCQQIRKTEEGYTIVGDLTIRGISKKMIVPVKIYGPVKSPFGGEVMGVSGEIVIDRRDFGMTWNNPMPDMGVVVGNEVRIIVDIEAQKKD